MELTVASLVLRREAIVARLTVSICPINAGAGGEYNAPAGVYAYGKDASSFVSGYDKSGLSNMASEGSDFGRCTPSFIVKEESPEPSLTCLTWGLLIQIPLKLPARNNHVPLNLLHSWRSPVKFLHSA